MEEKQFEAAMTYIVAALEEKGYKPYDQLLGYVGTKCPVYITRYRNARDLIQSLNMDQIMRYIQRMER